MLQLARALRPARRAALLHTRPTAAVTMEPMPGGAQPQIILSAHGKLSAEKNGALKDIAAVIASQGASIASSRKIVLGGRFSLLMEVWCPPRSEDGADAKDAPFHRLGFRR